MQQVLLWFCLQLGTALTPVKQEKELEPEARGVLPRVAELTAASSTLARAPTVSPSSAEPSTASYTVGRSLDDILSTFTDASPEMLLASIDFSERGARMPAEASSHSAALSSDKQNKQGRRRLQTLLNL